MLFKPKAPKPLSAEANTRLERIKAGTRPREREEAMGPTRVKSPNDAKPGPRQELKGRPFGRKQ